MVVIVRGQATAITSPGALPIVVCWVSDELGGPGPEGADLTVGEDDVAGVVAMGERSPLAAATLAVLLRAAGEVDVETGLGLESACYAMLQAGPEFARWRAQTPPVTLADDRPTVIVERSDGHLTITLDRPERHNAVTARLRDELHAALTLATVDDSITAIDLRGNGPSFCSGGDLAEFGTRPDPATAHVTRLARSPARLLHHLRARVVVHVHGATLGGGLEMASFADRIIADPDTSFGLPELALGLVPGAGGTVGLPRRIGRQRTAALALTGRHIDARTALAWGLVDEIAGE